MDKHLRTGGDPRALPDYAALRDELIKLSHPARPDVNWKYAETLCLGLFEHNGVELQSAAWYTLARMHIAGLAGMNEGLALINALTAHQWAVMWPGHVHARMEIIAGLNQRLRNVFRTLVFIDRDDLSLLYQAERNLTALAETLARHELKQVSRTDVLQQQIRQAITRLENSSSGEQAEPAIALPVQAVAVPQTENAEAERLVFVAQAEPMLAGAVNTPSGRQSRISAFIAGACSALFAGGVLLWGWNSLNHPSPAEQQLLSSLTPLPEMLSTEQTNALRQSSSVTEQQADKWIALTRTQLKWLEALPPGWPLQYGQALIAQANALRPDNPAVAEMETEWQRHIEINALPVTALTSWHDGMAKLQQLADKLNGLDIKRGKYMTVSELKSEVFAITQAFNQYPPTEERLRQYSVSSPDIQRKQAEIALEQLQKRYFLLQPNSTGKSLREQ